jgi:hypothetical protein
MTRHGLSFAERFWLKVDTSGECWEWQAARDSSGYGRFRAPKGAVFAHRFSHELHNGPIVGDGWVLHSCDNPPCVNPAHLREGTVADNVRDMLQRGRAWRQSLTHCHRGHPFDEADTRARQDGTGRPCGACARRRRKVEVA